MATGSAHLMETMQAAARAAGALTLDAFRDFRRMEIGHKGPADFVTDADRASEQLIREHLRPLGADWSFRGEEFAPYSGSDPHHEWLVDPIDGTTNFINGLDYTISIALRRDGETVCGVLYNPVADEMFTVERGSGAFANGRQLRVSDRVDPRLFNIGTGLPTSGLFTHGGFYSRLDRIRDQIGAIRIIGSSANSCAHVADGRLTGYFEESGLLDWAVGVLLVTEAGGIVTDWWSRDRHFYEKTGTVIAANPATHAFLIEQLADAPRKDPA